MDFYIFLIAAVIVEGVITYIKTFFVEHKLKWQMLASIGISIIISIVYQLDFLSLYGLDSIIPFTGNLLTGIFISRVSNYVYEIIKKISAVMVPRQVILPEYTEDGVEM